MDLNNLIIYSLAASGVVITLIATIIFCKYIFNWINLKIFSTKSRLYNFFDIIKNTINEVNTSNSSQKLSEEIKKGNDLYAALKNYTERHTFGGSDSLAYHLRYGVSRANSESYLNQLKSLAIESDRCSELIKDHISTVIKEVNEKSISPEFDNKPTASNQKSNQAQLNSNASSTNSSQTTNIPKSSIDLNTIDNNSTYTFIGFDANNNTRKRYKNIKGTLLRAMLEDINNGRTPQENIYPIYLESNQPKSNDQYYRVYNK